MVIYELNCESGHRFEGWFKDASSFEEQKKSGLVQCALCGSDQVSRVPSGCHVGGHAQVSAKSKVPQKSQKNDPVVLLKSLQKYVKDNFKDVGKKFTDQAIQMQKGEVIAEPIYGTADDADRDRLEEEGVSYVPLPKLPESVEN